MTNFLQVVGFDPLVIEAPKGDPGAQGQTGPAGPTGPLGPQGLQGPVHAVSGVTPDGSGNVDLSGTYVPGTANDLTAFDVFFPEKDGAVADGQQAVDGVATSGSTAFTSATANFTPSVTGKWISIPGAGVAGALLFTTITYVSATQVTLAVAASTSASSIVFRWGTDNAAALSATMTRASASVNGLIRFRHGIYLTSGTLTIPNGKHVTLRGDSRDFTGTTIMRFGATQTMVYCNGNVVGGSTAHFGMYDIEFHGGDLAGTVLDLTGVINTELVGVKLVHGTGTMLRAGQWFNSTIDRCYFQNAGNGRTTPAVLVNSPLDGTLGGGTNTLHFVACEWEGNTGTDLRITSNDGTDGVNSQDWSIAVFLTNCKMERDTGNYPLLDLDRVGALEVSDSFFYLGPSATNAHVEMKGAACVPVRPIGFSNCHFSTNKWNGSAATTGAVVPYFFDVTTGVLQLANVSMTGNPTSAFVHVGSTVGVNDLRMSSVTVSDRSKLILDDRSGSLYTLGSIPLTPVITDVAATLSVNRPMWNLPDAATSKITYATVPLPADASTARPIRVRLLWYSDSAAGAIRWDCGVRGLDVSGDDITVGQTDTLITATVPGTANRTNTTTFTSSINTAPGTRSVAIYISRLGSDAADTCTGGGRVLGAELLYERAM